eukprot:TRINITY_DN1510_c0_g1_i1.p1 TRINITY_DN1510_c0_g1~~TRINITY_DN1510_c0_g1_i1.p1  ORF type:complete len:290 (+),score=100.05 TRINITY_DN1510_c0_g1_i1:54-872(+)
MTYEPSTVGAIIFPPEGADAERDQRAEQVYLKSHRRWPAGAQKRRGYQWANGIDPSVHRFGAVQKRDPSVSAQQALEFQHAEKPRLVRRVLEDFKDCNSDALGAVRNRGVGHSLPSGHRFGKTQQLDAWGAKECMRGAYTAEEQLPDRDLGKPSRPLSRKGIEPPADDRVFGVPSVRSDLQPPRARRVTDNVNYGDDDSAADLLCPSPYAQGGVSVADFLTPVGRSEMKELADGAGYGLSDAEFDLAWNEVSRCGSPVPVAHFNAALDKLGL